MKEDYKSIVANFASEFEQALNKAGYITSTGKEVTMDLTPDEIKVVRIAVRGAIDLRKGYVNIPYDEDARMKLKKVKLIKELVHLNSALKKLK